MIDTRQNPLMILLSLLIISTFLMPITINAAQPVEQHILIVDITGNGDYTSIQEAIDNTVTNSIIKIRPGIYKENQIEVDKKISIIGDEQNHPTIDCNNERGITIKSSYVDIKNIKILQTGEYSISIEQNSNWCNLSNCILEVSEQNIGIKIMTSSNSVFNCKINGENLAGVGIELSETNNRINDCDITGLGTGVLVLINAHDNKIQNCNIYGNNKGIDIRINSNENTISSNNIYANEKGVYIWQNSNQNHIYLNNFWRNDIAATDENNNTWDNGIIGNYWDQYTGTDSDNNGMGDKPFTITKQNKDNYPLISMILPDEIIIPSNIQMVTPSYQNQPEFTWTPSVYNRGIKGYFIRIDNNPEIFISNINTWASPTTLSNGVHTFYIKAQGEDGLNSSLATYTFNIDTNFIDSDNDGWSDSDEQKYATDPNNPENYPLDSDYDKTPDTHDLDDDNDRYPDEMENSYKTSTTDKSDHPTDTDNDLIPDEDSPDAKYIGDVDDDDDYLIDTIEKTIGSNPKNPADAKKIYINGNPYFLVIISDAETFSILFNPENQKTTSLQQQENNILIDITGDNKWDYIYSLSDETITEYKEQKIDIPLIWIPIIIIPIIIILYSYKFYKSKNQKTTKITQKQKRKSLSTKTIDFIGGEIETKDMFIQTKTLLQNIQKDVSTYMSKLDQIENQISKTQTQETHVEEKTITTVEKIENKETKYGEIESKVDELLSKLQEE